MRRNTWCAPKPQRASGVARQHNLFIIAERKHVVSLPVTADTKRRAKHPAVVATVSLKTDVRASHCDNTSRWRENQLPITRAEFLKQRFLRSGNVP